jgi:flagellar hook-associated protein 3 FlgL
MRITNKIMQSHNLTNINTNKVYQDKLSTQVASTKKISRPSEDPVVAIRALRLRSDVAEVNQYATKNIPDAVSWLDLTESSLRELTTIMDEMGVQFGKGANGELSVADREVILAQLGELQDNFYDNGDADYAGRYLFTGYRTETSLRFPADTTKQYTITEQMDNSAIDVVTAVNTLGTDALGNPIDLMDLNESNYDALDISETDVSVNQIHRIRLAYNGGDNTPPTITFKQPDGTEVNWTADVVHSYEDPYSQVGDPTGPTASEKPLVYVPETGEILMSDSYYDQLIVVKDNNTTSDKNESEIRITYEKSTWKEKDLRPEHYFYCTSAKSDGTSVEYNAGYLDTFGLPDRQSTQAMTYDVGFTQSIQINTTAGECFDPGIAREIDDLRSALSQLSQMEDIAAKLTDMQLEADETQAPILAARLKAMNKAITFQKDKVQKMFEGGITAITAYADNVNLCITRSGTASSKLELITKRVIGQKASLEDLKSSNEEVDMTEAAMQLANAEFTYNAALLATSKVMQASLINYI